MTQRLQGWLRVGDVAKRTGLTVRTLHHYDAIGLLVPQAESAAGYRLYSPADLERLLSIQQLKSLGLSLDEIAAALDAPDFDAASTLEAHIEALTERLRAERELLRRLQGLREVSEIGWDEMLDVIALTGRLAHPDPSVRVRAALDSPATLPLATLVERLVDEPSAGVRETLTWAIARHGSDAVAALILLLHAKRADTRLRAAHVLSKVKDASATSALAPLLDDPEASVAAKAAFALGQVGGVDAWRALVDALGSPDPVVREEVTDALARLLHDPALPAEPLFAALALALDSPSATIRAQAADVAGLGGRAAFVPQLVAKLDDPGAGVRLAAVSALGELGTAAHDAVRAAAASPDAQVAAIAARLASRPRS